MSAAADAAPAARRAGWSKLDAALAIVVAWSFAVAQPLLDLFGRNAEFFVARDSEKVDLLLFAFGVTIVAPLVLVSLSALIGALHRGVGRLFEAAVLVALFGTFGLRLVTSLVDPRATFAVGMALLFGGGLTVLFRLFQPVRVWVRYLSPVPVLFLASFVFFSSVSTLLFPARQAVGLNATVRNAHPVVMIVFDELPTASLMTSEGDVDARMFPNFARLASTSTWYRNTTAANESTSLALPAILDGIIPTLDRRVPVVQNHPQNLFTLLGGAYDVRAHEPVTALCPSTVCESTEEQPPLWSRMRELGSDVSIVFRHQVLPSDLTRDLPPIDQTWGGFQTGDSSTKVPTNSEKHQSWIGRAAAVHDFVEQLGPGGRPRLDFVHVMLPHSPWEYVPSGHQYGNGETLLGYSDKAWTEQEWPPAQAYQRHLLQLRYVDALLGEVFQRLDETGTFDDSAIVVTADHGNSFVPGEGRRLLGSKTLGGVAFVPFFLKAPEQREGVVDDSTASTIDVLPTLARVLDFDLAEPVDGVALGPGTESRDGPRVFYRVPLSGRGAEVIDLPPGPELLFETVRRKHELFAGLAESDAALYAVAPHEGLIGQPAALLGSPEPAELDVQIDGRELLRAVDPETRTLPVFLVGRVTSDLGPGDDPILVAAVNGQVAAMTEVVDRGADAGRFTMLLDPDLVHAGANELALYVLDGGRLHPIEGQEAQPTQLLADATGALRLSGATGDVALDAESVTGFVSVDRLDEHTLRVHGWAADLRSTYPADLVLVFSGRELIYSAAPSEERADIADNFLSDRLLGSGFTFLLPSVLVDDELRVVGVRGEGASLLVFDPPLALD